MNALERSAVLSEAEARSLTDEVKHDAERLWRKVVELRDGEAHVALGYSSWRSYWAAEFGGDGSRGDQLARAGKVMKALGEHVPALPSNDRQARELAPLLDEPEQLREAWSEASANGEPTAATVREVVQRRLPKPPQFATAKDQHATMVRVWDGACRVLDDDPGNAAAKVAHLVEYDGPGPVTPERLEIVAAFCRAAAKELRQGGN